MRILILLCTLGFSGVVLGQDGAAPANGDLSKQSAQAVNKAIAYFRTIQNENGSFGQGPVSTGITGMVIASTLQSKQVTVSDPMIAKALKFLEGNAQADGGIYAPGAGQRNYTTSICIMAFTQANKDKKYQAIIDKAVNRLKTEQWGEGDSIDGTDARYGGSGYGGADKTRPDLSNTTMMIDALRASGLSQDDVAFKRAIAFVTHCQNYSGESGNQLPIGKKINDGGFFYTPVENVRRNPGENAGKSEKKGDGKKGGNMTPEERAKRQKMTGNAETGFYSYGSMTYAGLKSYLYAGLKKEDPRVQAAIGWVRKHYSLEENPGRGRQGLFYYYHAFAIALNAVGVDQVEDSTGKTHDWRKELIQAVVSKQSENGSWVNTERTWMEDQPVIVTCYALFALNHAAK